MLDAEDLTADGFAPFGEMLAFDAAVADVFGTLLVSAAVARTWRRLMPSSYATICATLVLRPWLI